MARIFISYRREDGITHAGRVYDRLIARYGEAAVFMDLAKIATGADYVQTLDAQLASCEVLLALIGPHWLVSRKGRKRFADPNDFVRREIQAALERGVRILPVLIGEAQMPTEQDLPPELSPLTKRNALRIRDDRFDVGMDSLILDIEEPDRPPEDTALARWQRLRAQIDERKRGLIVGTLIVLGTMLAAWASALDVLTLDTRIRGFSVWLGDIFVRTEVSERVIIVGIDEATERALQRPFDRSWRAEHATLIERLSQAGASAIVFDMYFKEPSELDSSLVEAMRQAQAKGTAVFVGTRVGPDGTPDVVPAIEKAASGVGLLCVGHRLGFATTAPMLVAPRSDPGGALRWDVKRLGLAVLAAFGSTRAVSLDATERRMLVPDGERVREIQIGALERVRTLQIDCPAMQPPAEVAQLLLRVAGREAWRPANWLKYEDLLPGTGGATSADARLKGKIVLVGLTGLRRLPDVHTVWRRFSAEERYGVELHAEAINNLLAPTQLHPLHWGGQLLFTIASVGMALLVRLSAVRLSGSATVALVLAVTLVYLVLSGVLCATFSVLLNSGYHLAAFGITYWLLGKLPALARR